MFKLGRVRPRAGKSLSGFGFTSADTPAELSANSAFFPTFPATTSFVYQGGPLVGESLTFASVSLAPMSSPSPGAATVPEPSMLVIGSFVATVSVVYFLEARKIEWTAACLIEF